MSVHIARIASRRREWRQYERFRMSAFALSFRTAFELIVQADPALVRTVALSLWVSGCACLIASGFGLWAPGWPWRAFPVIGWRCWR
jgi:hypothetical protein